MIDHRPVNNLPPGSQPWARAVEQKLDDLSFTTSKLAQDSDNAFKTINSTMSKLADQIIGLSEAYTQLANLTANQVTATAQNAVSANLPSGTTGSLAVLTISVPSGYTRAAVTTIVSISTLAGTGRVAVTPTIFSGPESYICPANPSSGDVHTVVTSEVLSNLSGSFTTRADVNLSTVGFSATNTTMVIFLK